MTEPQLPDKLSALLRIAVRDAQKCEVSDEYVLDMSVWYAPSSKADDDTCSVCMAGAVMAQTLKASPHPEGRYPSGFDDATAGKLRAIDNMRMGDFIEAAQLLGVLTSSNQKHAALHECSSVVFSATSINSGRASWETYLKAANILEAVGL